MPSEVPYLVEGAERKLAGEDWDVLIILDACRYDFFKRLYSEHIGAELGRAVSPATCTMEWLSKVFPGQYKDTVYISANPYINSKKASRDRRGHVYDGKKHFFKVIDSWLTGWDDAIKSVPPERVTAAFRKARLKYPKKRIVLHYIQPHFPYIGESHRRYLAGVSKESIQHHSLPPKTSERRNTSKKDLLAPLKKRAISLIFRFFGTAGVWRTVTFLHPNRRVSQQVKIYLSEGWEGIRKAYEENLRIVLKEAFRVASRNDLNILITSDHGELLGEHGLFGHRVNSRKRENTEVPWLVMRKGPHEESSRAGD